MSDSSISASKSKVKKGVSLDDRQIYCQLNQDEILEKGSGKWQEKRRSSLMSSIIEDQSDKNNPQSEKSQQLYKVKDIKKEEVSEESQVQQNMEIKKTNSILQAELQKSFLKEEEQLFKKYKLGYLSYLKGVHVLKEIISQIEGEQLLNLKEEVFLQFMFLISIRSYNYLSIARGILEKVKSSLVKEEMQKIYACEFKAKSKFQSYSFLINENEKKIKSRLRSVKQFFHVSSKNQKKYLFLDGFEGSDYTVEEQISFTYHNYMEAVLNSPSINSKYFKNHRLRKALKSYKLICGIKENEVNSKEDFEKQRDRIMIDQE